LATNAAAVLKQLKPCLCEVGKVSRSAVLKCNIQLIPSDRQLNTTASWLSSFIQFVFRT